MFDVATTMSLLRDMSHAVDPQDLLGVLLAYAHRSLHVDRAIVLRRDGLEHPMFRVVLSSSCGDQRAGDMVVEPGDTFAGGILADLLYAGEIRTVSPLVLDGSEPSRAMLADCRSLAAFPLYDHGQSVGMVVLLGPTERQCGTADLCGLAVLGALLQRADRAHALGEQLATTCRALDAELAAVASVQQWLLPPQAAPAAGVDVASFHRAAHHASGDYQDAGPLPDGGFGVIIADVSGHGAAAAVLMAILRTVVHGEVHRIRIASPAALLDLADQHFCTIDLSSRGAFITAFSGALDTKTGRFVHSCAGHPSPLLLRATDGAVLPIAGARSLPLGILDHHPPRTEETTMLGAGDLILLYSDGITEARSRNGEFFGVERLQAVLGDLPRPTNPEAAIHAVTRAVVEFTGAETPADDQALLAVQWQRSDAGSPTARS